MNNQSPEDSRSLIKALGRFLADVAHELNNPIGGIMGLAQLLLQGGKLAPEDRQDVESILSQGQHCQAIVSNLLLFTRRQEFHQEYLELSHLLHSTLGEVQRDFLNFGLDVVDECPSTLPLALGDAVQLRQVFLYLLMNIRRAVAGQKKKTLVLEGGCHEGRVYVRLRDNGHFNPKGDQTEPDLGWTICDDILQVHQGALSVVGDESGTVMTLELPAHAVNT